MRTAVIVYLLAPLLFLIPLNTNGENLKDPCSAQFPDSLRKAMQGEYLGWKVVTPAMLNPYHKKLFTKDHKGNCPGLAKVDLYGHGRAVYAMVLERDGIARLLMAQQLKGKWQLTTLEGDTRVPPVPVVVAMPAGEYEQVYKERTLKSVNDVIAYIGYESWAIVYAWDGKEIQKVHIND